MFRQSRGGNRGLMAAPWGETKQHQGPGKEPIFPIEFRVPSQLFLWALPYDAGFHVGGYYSGTGGDSARPGSLGGQKQGHFSIKARMQNVPWSSIRMGCLYVSHGCGRCGSGSSLSY